MVDVIFVELKHFLLKAQIILFAENIVTPFSGSDRFIVYLWENIGQIP